MRQRPQQMALALSKKARVLYVEPPTNFYHFYRNRDSILKEDIFQVNENLSVFRAIRTLPFKNYFYFLNKLYQNLLSRKVVNTIRKLSFKNPMLWLTFPAQSAHLGKYDEKYVIYECMDDYAELETLYGKSFICKSEDEIIKNSNLVVTTSHSLFESKSKNHNNVSFSPNAAEVEWFNKVVHDESIETPKLFDNNNPVVGYIGAIREWLDLELIRSAVSQKPEWNFLFIGPVNTDVSNLKSFPNVQFTGYKDYSELPKYLKLMDVTVVPFKLIKLIEHTNPIKIYEYLAAGKPVVATNFPEAAHFGSFVKTASNTEEFILKISECFNENSKEEINKRLEFASNNSWDKRAEEILEVILKS